MCRIPVVSTTGALTEIDLLAICTKIREVSSASAAYKSNNSFRAVAQLGRAPGSGPGGRGFKSHQPDKIHTAARAKCSNQAATVLHYSPDLAKDELSGAVALDTAYCEALWRYGLAVWVGPARPNWAAGAESCWLSLGL